LTLGEVTFHDKNTDLLDLVSSEYGIPVEDMNTEAIRNARQRETGFTIAEVRVRAHESKHAEAKALMKLNQALNALRLYYKGTSPFIEAEKPAATRDVDIFNLDTKSSGSALQWIRHPLTGVVLSPTVMKDLRSKKFDQIENIYNKTQAERTEIETNLLTAIYWHGESLKDENNSAAFAKCIYALEALVVKGDTIKKQNLAERIAFLLSKDRDNRKVYYDEMRNFYEVRNRIVHEGFEDVDDILVSGIQFMTRVSIWRILEETGKWKTMDEMIEWIQDQKFS